MRPLLLLTLILPATVVAGLLVGPRLLPPEVLVGGGDDLQRLLFSLRLPRVATAALGGAALAVAGTAVQASLRNPLADPYVLGLSSGAGFGSLLALALGFSGRGALSVGAFLGALAAAGVVFLLAGRGRGRSPATLLLAGVAVGFFFSAGMMLLLTTSRQAHLTGVLFWLMGDLGGAPAEAVATLGPPLLLLTLALLPFHRPLDLLALGETEARSRGLNARRFTTMLLAGVALLVGLTVSLTGLIGFVGLIVPHAARRIVGGRHALLLPAALGLGATFLVLCDAVARTAAAPTELPVGAVTAAIGAPFFLWLLLRRGGPAGASDA